MESGPVQGLRAHLGVQDDLNQLQVVEGGVGFHLGALGVEGHAVVGLLVGGHANVGDGVGVRVYRDSRVGDPFRIPVGMPSKPMHPARRTPVALDTRIPFMISVAHGKPPCQQRICRRLGARRSCRDYRRDLRSDCDGEGRRTTWRGVARPHLVGDSRRHRIHTGVQARSA